MSISHSIADFFPFREQVAELAAVATLERRAKRCHRFLKPGRATSRHWRDFPAEFASKAPDRPPQFELNRANRRQSAGKSDAGLLLQPEPRQSDAADDSCRPALDRAQLATWLLPSRPKLDQKSADRLHIVFAGSVAVGVTITTRPSNRSARANRTPFFSLPASGWLPTKSLVRGNCSFDLRNDRCLVLPASVKSA